MTSSLRDFFPPIEPHASGMMKVDDIHTIYWEECGNPQGVPVIFLHGGPGAGASPTHRRFFDPKDWRIIIFDQRGSGRSHPLGETRSNTTELLIEDIESLRRERGVDRWHVFGGSWGSTLALAYAQTHPDRCLGLILRGICLMQQREVDWFLYGIRNVFPEAWEKFAGFISADERHNLLAAYNRIFHGTDEKRRREAIQIYAGYETWCSSLLPGPTSKAVSDERRDTGLAVIEGHYFTHNLFKPETKLLDNVGLIRHIPCVIVQGRYDMVCPIITADELHRAWPEAEYKIIPDAGHSALEPSIRSALIEATERFKRIKA